jgi:hypothetical protein
MGPPLGSYSLYKTGWEFYPFFGDRLPFLLSSAQLLRIQNTGTFSPEKWGELSIFERNRLDFRNPQTPPGA